VYEPAKRLDRSGAGARERPKHPFEDEAHFIKTLFESPRATGAVSPSGRFLARAMARAVEAAGPGLVVELGPGTGPVTKALIERGVAPENLVLVEYEASFCRLLAGRFPQVRVLQGDAYRLTQSLAELRGRPIRAIVSSLPLLNEPPARRQDLVTQAFALMGPEGAFVQFTYGVGSPVPRRIGGLTLSAAAGPPIWLNLPPARVWTYRIASSSEAVSPAPRLRDKARVCAADMIAEAKRSKALAKLRGRPLGHKRPSF
jgi:phosphatidylethanolamine/phosphatidyl-N-methylethanolamine N-methyltransferase